MVTQKNERDNRGRSSTRGTLVVQLPLGGHDIKVLLVNYCTPSTLVHFSLG